MHGTIKGRIVREYAVTVEHADGRVDVFWDGAKQYSTVQDGWTTEAGAIREAATLLIDTLGCRVEIVPDPYTDGAYVMRLRSLRED